MDRPINTEYLGIKKRWRLLKIALITGGIVGVYFFISAWIQPSVNRHDIRTARVYAGVFESTLSASGIVMPGFEEVLTSPVDTRVLAILKNPGEMLARGAKLVQLDTNALTLALERSENDLTLKRNQRTQAALDMDKTLNELRSQLHIKELRLAYAHSKTVQQEKIFAIGAISRDQLDQAKMDEQIASIERDDMEKNVRTSEASFNNQLNGLDAEVRTLQNERDENRRELEQLSCKATRDGVLTWIVKEIGGTIHAGDPLAKISDLSGYRIDAQMSDVNAARIALNQPVRVRLNETILDGAIASVYPAIENGVVKFTVRLNDKANKLLRPNLTVDVFVVLGGGNKSLLVEKGPFLTGDPEQPVFVVHGDRAVTVPARIGAASFDRVELASGVREGDEIIVSDMKDYIHLKELRLK